jgi:hypothetical protein
MNCPLCQQRKGKRACPAKSATICPHCCGAKRRVEIDCPDDCVWLGAHAGSWAGRETERRRDLLRVAPHLRALSDEQSRLFFLTLVGIDGIRRSRRDLDDRLLAESVAALRKTVETRARGVLYEHAPEDLRAQGLLTELKGLFTAKDAEGRATTPDDRDLLPVLIALDTALTHTRDEGVAATAFLDTVARLVKEMSAASRSKARPLIVAP